MLTMWRLRYPRIGANHPLRTHRAGGVHARRPFNHADGCSRYTLALLPKQKPATNERCLERPRAPDPPVAIHSRPFAFIRGCGCCSSALSGSRNEAANRVVGFQNALESGRPYTIEKSDSDPWIQTLEPRVRAAPGSRAER